MWFKLDNTCPACGNNTGVAEATEGEQYECDVCDAELTVGEVDGKWVMLEVEPDEEPPIDEPPLCPPARSVESGEPDEIPR